MVVNGNILMTRVLENPRAVVVILGHLGASQNVMEQYADWYTERQCSVVTGTSPPNRFMRNQSLKPVAMEVWSETAKILRRTPPTVPVAIHLFSNGGAFLLEDLDLLLEEGDGDEDASSDQDYDLIAQRLKSGSALGRGSYTFCASWSLTFWCTATLSWGKPERFWRRMKESRTCLNNIYAYTTTDLATDAFQLDQLIEHRRTELGANCKVYKYDDSNHCRLARDHPEEYMNAIEEALEAAVQRGTSQTTETTH